MRVKIRIKLVNLFIIIIFFMYSVTQSLKYFNCLMGIRIFLLMLRTYSRHSVSMHHTLDKVKRVQHVTSLRNKCVIYYIQLL